MVMSRGSTFAHDIRASLSVAIKGPTGTVLFNSQHISIHHIFKNLTEPVSSSVTGDKGTRVPTPQGKGFLCPRVLGELERVCHAWSPQLGQPQTY